MEAFAEGLVYLVLSSAPVACGIVGLAIGAWSYDGFGATFGSMIGALIGIAMWRRRTMREAQARAEAEAGESVLSRAIGRRRWR